MLNTQQHSTNKIGEFSTFIFSLYSLLLLEWFVATQNIFALRILFPIVSIIMMLHRIYEFCFIKKCPLFLMEFCYVIWIWSVVIISMNADVRYIYPFLHGPLILFTALDGEPYIFNNMNKITSVMLHNFAAVIVCVMYLNSNNFEQLDKLHSNFLHYFKYCMIIFGSWFVPFSVFLFVYNGTAKTLLRHKFVSNKDQPTPFNIKITYFFCYLIVMVGTISFGIVSMHCIQLSYTMMLISLTSIIVNTSWYYYSNGDKSNKFSIAKLINLCIYGKNNKHNSFKSSELQHVIENSHQNNDIGDTQNI